MLDPIKGNLDGMWSGRHRERTCSCGQPFTQFELSKKFAEYMARQPESTQRAWKAAVKENALPVFCIRCERRELGFEDQRPYAPISQSLLTDSGIPRQPSLIASAG